MASALALSTSVAAEGPNIYYPQRVKRDNQQSPAKARGFVFDKPALFQQPATPAAAAPPAQDDDNIIGGLVSDLFGGDRATKKDPVIIVVSKTITVPVGTGILPVTTVSPTKSTKTGDKPTDPVSSQSPTSETGIIVDPTSVHFPSSSSTPVVSIPGASTSTPATTPATTPAATPSTSTPGGIISIITSILGPDPSSNTTSTPPATPTTSSSVIVIIPTSSSTSELPITTTPGTTSLPPVSVPPTTSIEVNTTSIETRPPVTISTPTSLPVTITSSSIIVPPVNETSSSVVVVPTSAGNVTSVAPETPIAPTTTLQTSTSAPPNTQTWVPTSMVVEPTTMSFTPPQSTASSQTTQQALPSDVPQNILPPKDNTPTEAPKGTVAIQIGFLFPLNYNFVANNTDAASQIFLYLPQALAAVAGVSADKVPVNKLVPFDTRVDLGYITTLAKINYPKSSVDALKSALWEPSSVFYNNQMDIVRSLTAQVNPKIPLLANNDDEGLNFGGSGNNGAGNTNGGGDSFQSSDSSNQTSKQKATTIGIAVGSLGVGVMYGAAMFIVARRYKRKRALQRRGSMSAGSAEMQFNESGSPALMGGALLASQPAAYGGVNAGHQSPNSFRGTPSPPGAPSAARAAGISNPVATENSLGWN